MKRLLFVCLGNICRSPLAEILASHLASERGLNVDCDSAGLGDYHVGDAADARSRACARRHGLTITHRARTLAASDWDQFDLIIGMDNANHHELLRRAPSEQARQKVHLLREWDPAGPGEVPDPYYGGEADFEHVWHLCERSLPRLLDTISDDQRRRA